MRNKGNAPAFHFAFGKRADVSSIVLVFLCLTLFMTMLSLINLNKNKIEVQMSAVYYMGESYSGAESFKNSVHAALAESFLDSYQKVLAEQSSKFGKENFVDIKSSFGRFVEVGFQKLLNDHYLVRYNYETEDEKQKDKIGSYFFVKPSSRYEYNYSSNGIVYRFFGWKDNYTIGSSQKTLLKVDYTSDLNISVEFKKLGLPDFDEINFYYNNCKEVGNNDTSKIRDCLQEELRNFDVSLLSADEKKFAIVSRDKYYVDNEMKRIVFELSF